MSLSDIFDIFICFTHFLCCCFHEWMETALQNCLVSTYQHADPVFVGPILNAASYSISLEEKMSLYQELIHLHDDIKYRIVDAKNFGWYYFHQSPSTEILILVKDIVDREIYCIQLMLISFIQYCKFLPEFAGTLNCQLGQTDEDGFSLNVFLLDFTLPTCKNLHSCHSIDDDIVRSMTRHHDVIDERVLMKVLRVEKNDIARYIRMHERHIQLFDHVYQQWSIQLRQKFKMS